MPLAPHHSRLFALIVDFILSLVALNAIQLLMQGDGWDLKGGFQSAPPDMFWLGMWGLMSCRDLVGGASLGKRLLGIAATSAQNPDQPATLKGLWLRNALLILLPLEAVLVFTDPHMRRVGDKVGQTVVIAPPNPKLMARRLLLMAILFLGVLLLIMLTTLFHVRRSSAYGTAVVTALGYAPLWEAVGGAPPDDAELESDPVEGPIFYEQGTRRVHLALAAEGPLGRQVLAIEMVLAHHPLRWEPETLTLHPPEDLPPWRQPDPFEEPAESLPEFEPEPAPEQNSQPY